MPRVVTQLDLDLALIQQKTLQLKQTFKEAERAAAETKLAEKMVGKIGDAQKRSVVAEFRALKEEAVRAATARSAAADAAFQQSITPTGDEAWGMHRARGAPGAGFASGRGYRGGGMAAMQVQDIAVQAGMGTNATMIATQQLPQLLGGLGGGGAIIGAVVAIAGALGLMGQKAKEAFETMVKEGDEFSKKINSLIQTGSVTELIGGFQMMRAEVEKLNAESEKQNSIWGRTKGFFAAMAGGASNDARATAIGDQQVQRLQQNYELRKRLLELSDKDVEIALARARGETHVAEAMERQRALLKTIEGIKAAGLSKPVEDRLIANAKQISSSEADAKAEQEWKQFRETRANLARQFAAAERATAEAAMNDAQKLVELDRQRLDLEKRISEAKTEEDKLKLATEREGVEARIVSMQLAMAKEAAAAEEQRQKSITDLQTQIEKNRVAQLPPAERAAAIAASLKSTLASANPADPTLAGLDAAIARAPNSAEKERLLRLKQTAQQQQLDLTALAPKSGAQYMQKGDFAKAAGFLSGQNPNELIAVEAQKQTQQNADSNKLLGDIKAVLEQIRGKGGVTLVNLDKFTP